MNLHNKHPRHILTGFNDQSTVAPLPPETLLPIHLPLFFTFAESGKFTPQLTTGASMLKHYGDATFDFRSKFANHSTPFITGCSGYGNLMLIQRLRTPGIAQASIRISLDLLKMQVPIYERDDAGFYRKDVNGDNIPTGQVVDGYTGKYVISMVTGGAGTAVPSPGSMTEGAEQSILYPIVDIPAESWGSGGNKLGIRLSAPTTNSLEPLDTDLVARQSAYIYRLEVIRRANENSTPVVHKTLANNRYVEFSLNPDSYDDRYDAELFADEVIMPAYRDIEDRTEGLPKFGPFETVKFYHDNIKTISEAIQLTESAVNVELPAEPEECYQVNLFGATNLNGTPYDTFLLHGSLDGEPEFTDISSQYLYGGADGDTSRTAFNAAVKEQLDNFGDLDVPYRDNARYPFSVFYDTGFDLDTKKSIAKLLGVRQDVHLGIATQDVNMPQLDLNQESSMAVSLVATLRLIPESIQFGTPCCRAVLMGQSGYIIGSNYKELVPLTYELCMKRARYMGAAIGTMKSEYSYDEDPLNHIEFLRDINNTWAPEGVRNKDWDAGLVTARYYDHERLHIPAIQTVYNDDSSVLNSDMNMQIAVELSKVAFRVWRELVGNSKLTKQQFRERSDEKIVAKTNGRFDNRVVIVPETYHSPADIANGSSWSANIHMYSNVNPAVAVSTIVTHRIEDLQS